MLRKVVIILFSLLLVITTASFVANVSATSAWTGTYHLESEWVKIWINQNGTIDLLYNISITLDSGDPISFVYVAQPKSDFRVGQAIDQYGNTLTTSEVRSEGDYKVRVNLHSPLMAGQTVWFTLITNVAHMILEDTENPGNIGMQFTPTWYDANVLNLRVLIVLPPNVTVDQVKTTESWHNTLYQDDRLAIYWEKQNLLPNEQFPVGVSFPKEYVQHYDKLPLEGQVVVNPVDDTYIESWSPNSNFGGQGSLEISNYEHYGETRQRIIWLKFNLSEVPDGAVVDVAILELYSNSVPETYNVYAHSCFDNSWTELTLTYSNMPTFNLTQMDLAVVSRPSEWYNWSIVDAVKGAIDGVYGGSNILTIVLLETSTRGDLSSVSFYSKEETTLYKPKLTIHWNDIIPEFPSFLILLLFMILTLLTVIVYRRKHTE